MVTDTLEKVFGHVRECEKWVQMLDGFSLDEEKECTCGSKKPLLVIKEKEDV